MRNFIRRWLGLPTYASERVAGRALGLHDTTPLSCNGTLRFTIFKAANGHIIEAGTFKANPNGPDWAFEHYLVTGDERLSEALIRVMAIKHLEQ